MKSFYIILTLCSPIWCYDHKDCVSKISCSECIQTLGCIWCSKPSEREGESLIRCAKEDKSSEAWCPQKFVVNVKSYYESKKLKLTAGDENSDPIQITPQNIKIGLKPGQKSKFNLSYQSAVDYPTDLYYLMDLSASMADDRDMLSHFGSALIESMKNMTNNLHMGFGSFVDKPIIPFVNTLSRLDSNKCVIPGTRKPCFPAYSFKNHMALTDELNYFTDEIKNAPISGNIDLPEGGLDALMQVLVCTKHIGWRDNARKIVIFSTDSESHIAGDGKLAGIVTPNDEECHMDEGSSYTNSLITDYPSISQLDLKARENNINVIFAVTKDNKNIYEQLSSQIHGSTHGILSKDSSNVVDLVKAEYNKIVESITLTDDASEYVKIDYYTTCLGNTLQKTNECGGLKGRPIIEFSLELELLQCPENKSQWNQLIHIRPGSLNENVTIELEALCQCPCESETNIEVESKNCNSNGNLTCGICSCDEGRFGRFCECDGSHKGNGPEDDTLCRPDNDTEVCSNRGICKCGKCDCMKRSNLEENIYGQFCECDNFSCQRNGGLLCSGHDRGRCECGACSCLSGWTGPGCECKDSVETCRAPESEEICSGNGVCECGVCKCQTTEKFIYTGQFCEECPHCISRKCNELKPCVECTVYKSGIYNEQTCEEICGEIEIETIKTYDPVKDKDDYNLCTMVGEIGCQIVFKYKIKDDENVNVQALENLKCSEKVDTSTVIFSAIFTTVLAGLFVMVIWKIVTIYHDRREYEQFEKERNTTDFDRGDNPLYQPSVSTFNNPVYGMQ